MPSFFSKIIFLYSISPPLKVKPNILQWVQPKNASLSVPFCQGSENEEKPKGCKLGLLHFT
jgi:hypothetical protein